MIKVIFLVLVFSCGYKNVFAQPMHLADSLRIRQLQKKLVGLQGNDRVDCLNQLSREHTYATINPSTSHLAFYYAKQAENLALKINYKAGLTMAKLNVAFRLRSSVAENKALEEIIRLAQEVLRPDIIGWAYTEFASNEPNRDKAIIYWTKAIENFERGKDYIGLAEANLWLGREYSSNGSYELAFQHCQRSLEASKKPIKEISSWRYYLLQEALVLLSTIYETVGDYGKALNSLKLARQYGSQYSLEWKMDNALGPLYGKMNKHDSALYYLKKNIDENPRNFYTHVFLAEYYLDQKKFGEALQALQTVADTIRKRFRIPIERFARVQLDYGIAYSGLGEYDKALKSLRNGLLMDERSRLLDGYKAMAESFYGLKVFDSAFIYTQRFKKLDDSISSRQYLWKLNSKMYEFERSAQDLKRANEMSLLQKDLLLKGENIKQQALLQKQSEDANQLLSRDNQIKQQELEKGALLKKEKESQLLALTKDIVAKRQQLKQQFTIRKLLVGGILLFALACVFIVRTLSLKGKNEKMHREMAENKLKVQQLEAEKSHSEFQHQASELEMQALRAQMNPHFIFNCLSSINKYIMKNETEAASDYLTRFSRLIRMVLVNSQRSIISLEDELDMLRLYLDMERLRFKNNFDYNISFTNTIEPSVLYIPPLLMQPFCENAIWHGLMHKQGRGSLNINLTLQGDYLICSIIDNGVGRERAAELKSKSAEKQKSMGLKITSSRLALFNQQKEEQTFYDMHDIIDEHGNIQGTNVNISIRYKPLIEEKSISSQYDQSYNS